MSEPELTPKQHLILATIYNRELEGLVRDLCPLVLAALDVAKRGATPEHLEALRAAVERFDVETWPKMREIVEELSK